VAVSLFSDRLSVRSTTWANRQRLRCTAKLAGSRATSPTGLHSIPSDSKRNKKDQDTTNTASLSKSNTICTRNKKNSDVINTNLSSFVPFLVEFFFRLRQECFNYTQYIQYFANQQTQTITTGIIVYFAQYFYLGIKNIVLSVAAGNFYFMTCRVQQLLKRN